MMDTSKVLDKAGHEIKVGSYIVYGHALGRCAALRIGKVLDIKWVPKSRWSEDSPLEPHVTVWGVDDSWYTRPATLARTRGTLLFPDRTLVLNDEQVPAEYQTMLEPVTLTTKKQRGRWG